MFGPTRLLEELCHEGYPVAELRQVGGESFAVISSFEIPVGRFVGREIDLGIPATPDFPRSVGPSVHIRAVPHLVEFGSVQNQRNVQASVLGSDWQYWSHRLMDSWVAEVERPAQRLIQHIHSIFDRV